MTQMPMMSQSAAMQTQAMGMGQPAPGPAPMAQPAAMGGGMPQPAGVPMGHIPQPGQGIMQYAVDRGGQQEFVDDAQVFHSLAQAGYNPVDLSPDGMRITLQDEQGAYDVEIPKVLQNFGMQVMHSKPNEQAVAFDAVDAGMRHAVMKLPDDDSRRAYLETQMRKRGMPDPQITGSGRNWYLHQPGQGGQQYIALTNSPGIDKGDFAEGGSMAGRMLAGGLGAVGGTALGGPAGGALGYAGGASLADAAERTILGAFDQDYAEAAPWERQAEDIALGGGVDLALGGLGAGVGQLARSSGLTGAIGQGLRSATAPVSTAAQGLGFAGQMGGGAVRGVAGGLRKPFASEMTAYSLPVVGPAATAGWLSQLPRQAATGSARGLSAVGRSRFAQQYAPGVGTKMAQAGERMLRPRASGNIAEEMAARVSGFPGPGQTGTARDVFGNVAERMGQAYGSRFGPQGQAATQTAFKEARAAGMPAEDAYKIGRQALGDQYGQRWGRVGESIGDFTESVGSLGRGLEAGAVGTTRGVLGAAQGIGYGVGQAGRGMRGLGTIAAPLESRGWGQLGAEELRQRDQFRLSPWQWGGNRPNIFPGFTPNQQPRFRTAGNY